MKKTKFCRWFQSDFYFPKDGQTLRAEKRCRKSEQRKRAGVLACAQALEGRRLLTAAYLLDTISSFNPTNGAYPQATPVFDSAGNLFGTTSLGGANNCGTVFEIAHGTTAITTVASFNGTNGANPFAGLILDSSGNLFGTTSQGGASDVGTVFKIVKGTTAITLISSFNGTNGANPAGNLSMDAGGNLFGVTGGGGAGSHGTVFEIIHGTTTITSIASFNMANGTGPSAGVTIDSSGNLFGTTNSGGAGGNGTVFEIVHGTTTITTVGVFNGINGTNPAGVSLDSSGNLFGTTLSGGSKGVGTVFEIIHGTTTITTIATFNTTNGAYPGAGPTLDSNGNLFGTTSGGGVYNYGTVFEILHGTTAITTLASFNKANGANPRTILTLDSSGNLFGTTHEYGTGGYGTTFEIASGSAVITTLASFCVDTGATPAAAVTLDSSGNLFGTTTMGGVNNYGTVFEIAHGGTAINTLVNFDNTHGVYPVGGLILDSSGNLFGTTYGDGIGTLGTVFEIARGGTSITTIASFDSTTGASPRGGLTLDSSGNLFGTTYYGGPNNDGTVFEIFHGSNAITTIASFSGSNGANPDAGLTLDPSGNLFGTTRYGGDGNHGTVFEIVNGTTAILTLASFYFNSANGAYPRAGLTLDSSGNLFGTTSQGGASNYGTVFEIVHGTNTITTIANFNGTNGEAPLAGLVLDSSGNLFGTTYSGGANDGGTVFEIAHLTSVVTTLASFGFTNGKWPYSGVTLDSSGNLFGTTSIGGMSNFGTVFELSPTPPTLSLTTPPASATAGSTLNGGTGVQVSVLYPWGNLDTTDSSTVTLTLTGGTFAGGGTTATAAVVNGLATFSNLVINSAGTYTLTASDANYGGAASSAFTISAAAPAKLAFIQQPTGAAAGSAINPAVTVAVQDTFGNTVAGNTSAVTLTLGSGVFSSGGNSVTVNAVNGIATFSNLIINNAGSYTLTPTDGLLTGPMSSNFNVYLLDNLYAFNLPGGTYARAALIVDSNGNLFGTTNDGGAAGYGTVFEIIHGTTTVTTLASFNNVNGATPVASLTLNSSGDLFGTTANGGASGVGTVFEIVHGTTAITTLASFDNANGANPLARLTLDSSGNLFGTTSQGGASGQGTVFEIVHGTTAITTLVGFSNTNGARPYAVTLDSSGNLFGTTYAGGASNAGTVFEIIHGTTAITTIGSFNYGNGANPLAGVTLDSSGNLFGTTYQGGTSGQGTVFEIAHGTTAITTLASFKSPHAHPYSGVTLDTSGNLFGTTSQGGAAGVGTVFEIVHGTTAVVTLAIFNNANGAYPDGGVTLDPRGNLFGTTTEGGAYGYGTVFELSPTPPTLSFTTPPASGTTGSALNGATGIQVGVLYPWGNLNTTDTSTVTLTLTGGTFADGSTTKIAATVNGVATFTNLVISAAGSYTLTSTDSSLTSTASASFVVTPPGIAVVATSSNDSIYLRKDVDGTHVDEWLNSATPGTGTPTAKYLLNGAASLTIDGGGGNDQITIDQSTGDLLEATNGISNASGSISLKIIGTNSNDTFAMDGTNKAITWNTGTSTKVLYFAGVSSVEYQDTGGIDNVSVAGPIPLTFDMGPAGDVLNIAAGSTATVNFGSSNGDLTINGAGNTSLVFGSGNPTFQFVTTPVNPKPATGTISGVVFNDGNGDGKRESGDKPLAGRKLYIDSNHNGKPDKGEATAVTDATGAYHFTGLAAGTYRVREVLPAGYRASSPVAGYLDVAIANGMAVGKQNFGQTREAMISGVVFRDANGDGKRESSEAKFAGWVVYLDTNNNGKLDKGERSVTTGSDGEYSFVIPAGKYRLRTVAKKGALPTAASASTFIVTLFDGQTVTKDLGR